jgi:hypothetical protein
MLPYQVQFKLYIRNMYNNFPCAFTNKVWGILSANKGKAQERMKSLQLSLVIWFHCVGLGGGGVLQLIEDNFRSNGGFIKGILRGVSARNYRPCFRENQPKRSFSIKWKRAFWACFRENWVYKFGHRCTKSLRVLFLHRRPPSWTTLVLYSRAVLLFNEPPLILVLTLQRPNRKCLTVG